MKEDIIESDVLCIGGGIAGLMAAIRASELGAKVVIAEKANTVRSGSAGMGNDHISCYIPDIQASAEAVFAKYKNRVAHSGRGKDYARVWLERSFDIIKLWDSWGIPMKYQGKYEFAGHGWPGGPPLTQLKYSGQNQKPILTKEARKRGVEIVNRVMVFDLLHNDGVMIGALGIDTREERIIKFQTRSVFLGTGQCVRLYPGLTPDCMFNTNHSPSNTGDGRAIAYRAGAELISMEIPRKWVGAKYLCKCGKGTWVGVLRDSQDKAIGPFVTKPDKRYGDAISDLYPGIFEDYAKSGKGPIYMDCRDIADEDLEYMVYWLKHEGNTTLLDHLDKEGIDFRKNTFEFTTYGIEPIGGVDFNEKGETSVKGLYAAGDEVAGGIGNAAIFGWIAGESAAAYAREAESVDIEKDKAKIEGIKHLLTEIRDRKIGASWKEVNVALQQIMYDYAGSIRSETMLQAGLCHLKRLKQKAYKTMKAENQHELMHCLEVLNLIDVGEIVFIAANERKETRGTHVRVDYPFANPLMDKVLVVKMVDDKPVTRWKEIEH